jgi:hypothetical protein
MSCHSARAPMRRIFRRCLQCRHDYTFDLFITDTAWSARTWRIDKTLDAMLGKTPPPFTYGEITDTQLFGNRHVRHARFCTSQNDICSQARPCAVDRRLLQLKSIVRSSPDTVMGMACGLAMAVSSVSAYLITMRLFRTSFKSPTRTTRFWRPCMVKLNHLQCYHCNHCWRS